MEEQNEMQVVDQSKLAESVSDMIGYEFRNQFLVKPLEPVMVEKEFSKPIPSKEQSGTDENGIEATDYDKVETEVKTVRAAYRKGIVIKIPAEYKSTNFEINVGDTVVYLEGCGRWFDLCKDSQLVDMYSIVAKAK